MSESRGFGGAEQYVLSLAEGVAGLGHEVHVLAPSRAQWPLRDRGPWKVHSAPWNADALWPSRLWWLAGTVRRLRPDILHINLPSTYSASFSSAAPLGRALGCGVVTTEHLSMIGRSRRRALLKDRFTPYVQRVIAVSNATANALTEVHRISGDKIIVIYNGVDRESLSFAERAQARASLGIAGDATAIGCVGELIPRKGQGYLIEALAGLVDRFPATLELVVIGDGEDRDRLQRKVAESGLGGAVRLAGRVEGAGSLLRAFDVFVMPSLMEALPFALLEAMAAGIPAVASSVWGIPEVVLDGETGLLVPPGDVGALRDAIERLLRDPELRSTMGRRAEDVVEKKFSLDNMVRETVAVYEELAEGRSRNRVAGPNAGRRGPVEVR